MNDESQPRHSDGRFGPKTGSPAAVELTAHPEATFEYPPERYQSLEDYIAFWENVEVPTSTLDSMRTAYKVARQDFVERGSEQGWRELIEANPDWEMQKFGDPDSWMRRVQQARTAGAQRATAEWDSRYAPAIQRHEARTVARGLQMFYYSKFLGSNDEAAVLAHPVSLNGRDVPVAALRQRYGFCDQYSGFDSTAFEPNESRVIAEIENLRNFFMENQAREEQAAYLYERDAQVQSLRR